MAQQNTVFQAKLRLLVLTLIKYKVYFYSLLLVISFLIIALPRGLKSTIGTINLQTNSSPQEIRQAWGPGDAGSLLDAALTWSNLRQLDPTTQNWIVRLWSPGMPLIEVPLIWLTKVGIPIFWSLLLLTVTIWILVLLVILTNTRGRFYLISVSFLVLTWVLSWDFTYIIRDSLFYTEGISLGLISIALLMISRSIIFSNNLISKKIAIWSGLALGTSVYVRHVFDSAILLTIVVILVLICINIFRDFRNAKIQLHKKRSRKRMRIQRKVSFVKVAQKSKNTNWVRLAAIFIIAFMVTVPWRYVISPQVYGGVPGVMSVAGAGVFKGAWTKEIPYWEPFGVNWACKTDAQTCDNIQNNLVTLSPKELALLAGGAVLTNPIAYAETRLFYLKDKWVPGGIRFDWNLQLWISILYFFTPIPLIWLYCKIRDSRKTILLVLWGTFLLTQLLQLTIIHYETRYFTPIRFFNICFLVSLIWLRSSEKEKLNLSENKKL